MIRLQSKNLAADNDFDCLLLKRDDAGSGIFLKGN